MKDKDLLNLLPNLSQESTHTFCIFLTDDFEQFVQLGADALYLCRCARIEEDFLQKVIVLVQYSLGDGHVALEGGARCILMLHHRGKDEGRYERDGKRVGHGVVVLIEGVFKDVQSQSLVEVLEENLAHVVALADDDGILGAQLVEVGEGWAEHRVSGHIAESAGLHRHRQSGG